MQTDDNSANAGGDEALGTDGARVLGKQLRTTRRRERYALCEEIGRGGKGIVYRADDLELDRTVAVKILRPEFLCSMSNLLHLKREVVLASRVLSPSVVRVYDIGVFRKQPLIAMEFIDGESLHTLLMRTHRLLPSQVLSLGLQICNGLEAIHSAGIVHRDLKPGNLLMNRQGKISVSDFGVALSVLVEDRHMSTQDDISGTRFYASPEQSAGLPVDSRSDLYSFGLILLIMLTGTSAVDELESLRIHLLGKYTGEKHLRTAELRSLDALDTAIRGCLHPDRNARIPSADYLRRSLTLTNY